MERVPYGMPPSGLGTPYAEAHIQGATPSTRVPHYGAEAMAGACQPGADEPDRCVDLSRKSGMACAAPPTKNSKDLTGNPRCAGHLRSWRANSQRVS